MPVGIEVGLGPGDIVLDGDPAPPRQGAQKLPTFQPMSIVGKRSPISATAKLWFSYGFRTGSPHNKKPVSIKHKCYYASTDEMFNTYFFHVSGEILVNMNKNHIVTGLYVY